MTQKQYSMALYQLHPQQPCGSICLPDLHPSWLLRVHLNFFPLSFLLWQLPISPRSLISTFVQTVP